MVAFLNNHQFSCDFIRTNSLDQIGTAAQEKIGMIGERPAFLNHWAKAIKESEEVVAISGKEIKLLDDVSAPEKSIYSMLEWLLTKDKTPHLNKEIFSTIVIQRDPKFFKIACRLIQKIFIQLYDQVKDNSDPCFEKKIEVVIGNLIALLPFFDPEMFDPAEMKIPQKINGEWHLITYEINLTPMTATSPFWNFVAPFWGEPINIVELEPKEGECEGAHSIRSFQGTTFPAGKGMVMTLLADLFPFHSLGEVFLYCNRDVIESSLNRAKGKLKLCGQSLGGSTAMLVSLTFPDKVDSVMTFGSPKLYSWSISRWLRDREYKSRVSCFSNENDSVPSFGNQLPPGAEEIRVVGERCYPWFPAHAKTVAAQKNVLMVKVKKEDEKNWAVIGKVYLVVGPIFFALIAPLFLVQRVVVNLFHGLLYAPIFSAILFFKMQNDEIDFYR